jgi:putative membrane protein
MTGNVAAAFFHHLAAFLVVGTLLVELVMLRGALNTTAARSLLRMDMLYGIAALVVLVAGLVRVFYTEKGAAYYFASGPFLVKLGLFIAVGLLSIYPTIKFVGWRKTLKEGRAPELDDSTRRKMRMLIHVELTLLVVIILMAIMMARGIWYVG